MKLMTIQCSCLEDYGRAHDAPLRQLAAVRSQCPALYEVFIPDDVWPRFQNWHRQEDKVAYHRSVLLLALQRGYLRHLTSPVHRYLIEAGWSVRQDVRKQYRKDLQEHWIFDSHSIERHRKFRTFRGRLAELQFAEWLEQRGWNILGLEALREGPDIEASGSGRAITAFEVKFIGTAVSDFAVILNSLAGESAATSVSPYSAANYLLFRAYEAGKQLEAARTSSRIAVVVIDDLAWSGFEDQLREGWINWASPYFFEGGQDWEEFLKRQGPRYPGLPDDLSVVISNLDAVWILRQSSNYQYRLEREEKIPTV